MTRIAQCCALAVLLTLSAGSSFAQTVADGHEVGVFGGNVHTVSRDLDGRVLIGGDFNQVGAQTRNRVALLTPNGTLDSQFSPNIANGVVLDSLVDHEGQFVFVGSFTSPHSRVARYSRFGDPVPGFGAIIDGTVRAVVEDPDSNRLYIGGDFSQIGSTARSRVARLNVNGTADANFVPVEFTGAVRALAVQADGKLIVAGNIQRTGDIAARRLYRLNTDGSWDNSFLVTQPVGAPHQIYAVAVQADGRILVGGDFPGHLRRYNADGSRDTGYTPPALNNTVYSIELQPDGRALIGGDFTAIDGGQMRVIRLLESGVLDTSFQTFPGPGAAVRAIEVHPDGGMMIAGDFTQLADNGRSRVARLNASGVIERDLRLTAFDPDNFSRVRTVAEGPDGSLYVGGNFSRIGGVNRTHLARIRSDGSVDPTFQPTLNAFVGAIAVQANGRILVGGGFGQVNGESRGRLVRLMPDGSVDSSFSDGLAGTDGRILAIAIQQDGRIVVVGDIRNVSTGRRGAARLHPDGSLDTTFSIADVNDLIWALAIDPQGRLLIGGRFTEIDGFARSGLARLLPSGLLDPSFAPQNISAAGDVGRVSALLLRDDHLLVGGSFAQIDGNPCPRLARFGLNGVLQQCASSAPGLVLSLAERADGRFYAAGYQTTFEGNNAWVQLYDSVTTQNAGFTTVTSPVTSAAQDIQSVVVLSDGRIAVGGLFSEFGGQTRGGVARVRVDRDVRQELTWDANSQRVLWFRGLFGTERVGAQTLGPPRVRISQSCCNPDSFVAPPGGGVMQSTGLGNWELENFAGLPGSFYLFVESRAGEAGAGGSYTLRTPIQRFEGPPLPPVQADLSIAFSPSFVEVSPGETIAVKLDVQNLGPSPATGVDAFLEFGSGVELLDVSITQGDFDPETGQWRIQDMPASAVTASMTLILKINVQGAHSVFAEVMANELDPDYSNNSDSLGMNVLITRSDLQLVKELSPVLALPEELVEFELNLVNAGPEPAVAVQVQNQMPDGYSWRGLLSSDGSYDPATGLWSVGNLAVGQSATLRFAADVTNSGNYTSIALASSDNLDPDPDNNLAIAAIEPFTDLAVQVSTDALNPAMHEPFTVSVEVFNHGPMAAQNSVLDLDWQCFGLCGWTASHGNFAPQDGEWRLDTLGLNDEDGPSHAVLVLHGSLICDIVPGMVSASVSSSTRDPVPGNNSGSVTIEQRDQDRIFGDSFEAQEINDEAGQRGGC